MRSTGYIGPSDEVMQHWLLRNKNRAASLASRPDVVPATFFENSLAMSRRLAPTNSFSLAEKHIKEEFFFCKNRPFDTVMFPDGETLVRSGLPLDKMFMSASGEEEKKIRSFSLNVALDEYNEYMEFVPHVTDIDFLLEALFAPSVTTLDDFASFAASAVISSTERPEEMTQWFWESASLSLLEAAARSAFRMWMASPEWDSPVHEVPKLTPVFARFAGETVNMLSKPEGSLIFSYAMKKFISDDDMETFKFYSGTFPEGSSRFLGAFLKEATAPIRTSVCRNLGKGVALYMAGSADTIMLKTGEYGKIERYIPWAAGTASLFPESSFYALSLDLWTKKQREALARALESMTGKSLVIWTSANMSSVPEILLENDFITREAYGNGGFCFRAIPPEDTEDYLKKSGYSIKNLDRLPETANKDAKNILYEIGFIAKEYEDAVKRHKRDPFEGMQVNIPNEVMAVLSPYMLLPDDAIEEARYRTMKALGYKACDITRPVIVSDEIPDFYSWIAQSMESRAKIPKLDMDKIRKRNKTKKRDEEISGE